MRHKYQINLISDSTGETLSRIFLALKSQFSKYMNWKNYGKWHVDHIRPVDSFDLKKINQQLECFHYTNLQRLWAQENLRKGTKKVQL